MFPSFTSIDSEKNASFWLSRRAKIRSPRVGNIGQVCIAKASLVYHDTQAEEGWVMHHPSEGRSECGESEGQSDEPPPCETTACLCEGAG